jgi:hypothetical protein
VRPSLRFLALAVVGWTGVRAATLGKLPGADLFSIDRSEAKPPAIVATQFPAIQPVEGGPPMLPAAYETPEAPPPAVSPAAVRYVQGVVGVPVSMRPGVVTVYQLPPARAAVPEPVIAPRPTRFAGVLPASEPYYYAQLPPLYESPLSRVAGLAGPVSRPAAIPGQSAPVIDPGKVDRLQLATWALLRSQQTGVAGSRPLATGGQLGASQAGARLIYNYNRQIALAARVSSEVGRRGGEVAAGVRVRPLVDIPVWLTAERRQAVGRYGGGRNAWAVFLEGGMYERPLPWRFSFDTYLQAGVVGVKSRDWFVDGAFSVTRPVYRNFSAGFGVWGAAQPGLSRVDFGPRVSMKVRNNLKVHLDWRQKVAGNARPGSGPALTLSGDF